MSMLIGDYMYMYTYNVHHSLITSMMVSLSYKCVLGGMYNNTRTLYGIEEVKMVI